MSNLSNLTRKEQVLSHLRARINQWVDGPELATEAVGGSEGLKRLRELRADGHEIKMRAHPDPQRDIFQYRLASPVAPEHSPSAFEAGMQSARESPEPSVLGPLGTVGYQAEDLVVGPDEQLHHKDEVPVPKRLRDFVKPTQDGKYEYVGPEAKPEAREISRPVQQQALAIPEDEERHPEGFMFSRKPTQVVYGEVAICPRCHSKTTRGRPPKPKSDNEKTAARAEIMHRRRKSNEDEGSKLVDEAGILLFRDPYSRKPIPCTRCNGYGIVPNRGAIPFTPPTGPAPAAQLLPEEEAESEPAFAEE